MNSQRGSIVFAFLLILVLVTLGVSIMTRAFVNNKLTAREVNLTKAFWVAEAGVQKGVWEYKYNSCQGLVAEATGSACSSCSSCGAGNKILASSLASSAGDYDITINSANTLLSVTGSYPNRTDANKVQRSIRYTIGQVNPFSYAMFSSGNIVISNNALVDSYDSSVGLYGGANIKTNGDVGTNGGSIDVLTVENNAIVRGDASTGPGGTIDVGNGGLITGAQTHSNNIALPSVTIPSSLSSLSSSGTLSISNNATATLTAGSYKYSSINMSNNATLNITGDVSVYLTSASALSAGNNVIINVNSGATFKVYVDGVLNISNNATINNVSRLPSSFQIYSRYSGANGIVLSNNGDMYGAVYAPNTSMNINNNGTFYGSIIGSAVTLTNNGELHYDEQLANLNNPYASTVFSSWQEI